MRQQSLAAIRSGMTLTINEDHDLLRFQSLLCYDQDNIGKVLDVGYLIALTSTMKALLYQYSAFTETFTVDTTNRLFQSSDMTHTNWQTVITLLWVSFKSRLTFIHQEEYKMIRSKHNIVSCKPVSPKVVKVPADKAEPGRQKDGEAAKTKERPRSPPPKREWGQHKKVAFADDVHICIADVARHYRIATSQEPCQEIASMSIMTSYHQEWTKHR